MVSLRDEGNDDAGDAGRMAKDAYLHPDIAAVLALQRGDADGQSSLRMDPRTLALRRGSVALDGGGTARASGKSQVLYVLLLRRVDVSAIRIIYFPLCSFTTIWS